MSYTDPSTPDQTGDVNQMEEQVTQQGQSQDATEPSEDEKQDAFNTEVSDNLKARMEISKRNRREYFNEWKRNVELRLGKIASQYTGGVSVQDEVQTEINPDWYLTKVKTANLFSQVPEVQGTHENEEYAPAIPAFMKALRFELSEARCNAGMAMEMALNDIVNAAGVGGILVGWEARFVKKQVPAIDLSRIVPPDVAQKLMEAGKVPTKEVPEPVSSRFYWDRISSVDLLWPAEFAGADFNQGDFIGRSGRAPWGVAKNEFHLKDEIKDKVLATSEVKTEDTLRAIPNKSTSDATKVVKFDELWYWRYRIDPDCLYFDEIWRIVWIDGLDKPVIHEPWTGQHLVEETKQYVGSRIFPLQLATTTYISDNAIPPSDSSAARPQVNDMRRSRSMMFQQRERAIPMRWFDTNRVDPLIADVIMKGSVQGMIPTNGPGDRSFGEVARASFPSEDFTFDQLNKKDLLEMWLVDASMLGNPSPRQNKDQTAMAQAGSNARLGQERGFIARWFLRLCDVTVGLMALYGTFPNLTAKEKEQMQGAWDLKHVAANIALKIRPDSTVVLDVGQRIDRILRTLNMTVKSGYVNPKPLIVELLELSGFDPNKVVIDPKPPEPDPVNFSFRASGKEDLMNPLVIAMLMAGKRMPGPDVIEQAKQFLATLGQPPQPPAPPQGGAPGQPPGQALPPAGSGGSPTTVDQHPEWSMANKVAKRDRDIGGK